MAKPLGAKSQLIREGIKANPGLGNTDLAELLNGSTAKEAGVEVKANDVAQQKQQMKKAGELKSKGRRGKKATAKGKGGRGRKTAVAEAAPQAVAAARTTAGPVDLLLKIQDLASQCGGVASLKRIVDMLAGLRAR